MISIPTLSRGLPFMGALVAALAFLPSVPASAQTIAAVVNGTPVTSLEVRERRAFIRMTQRKEISARTALDDLINEVLVLREATRRGIPPDEADVDARLAAVARNVKLTPAQLGQALKQGGASTRTFKQNIRYQMVFRRLVGARTSQVTNSIPEELIATRIAQRKEKGAASHRYVLRQIIFVLPKNADAGRVAQRRREAEGLRGRFQTCERGVETAMGMRDVAVKDPVIRVSSQIGQDFRTRLDKVKVGHTTAPERTELGVEIVAVCERSEIADDSGLRQEIQLELADDGMKAESKKYLESLRRVAVIRYR